MDQPVDVFAPAIGACLNCRSLFLVTFDTPNCILCGNPPTYTLSFAPARPEPVQAPEEPAAPAADAVQPLPRDTVGSELILLEVISTFLDGGDIPQAYLSTCFQDVGADPEAAATAVGRLQAVRDLIRDVRDQGLKASVTVTGPALAQEEPEEGLPPPLTSEPAEEGDRTTVPSP